MYFDNFSISKLSFEDCALFLGGRLDRMPENIIFMMEKAMQQVLKASKPKAIFKVFDINSIDENGDTNIINLNGTTYKPVGHSICNHLKDSSKAVLLCATIGPDVDRLIKKVQLQDMAYALVVDAMAGVMIETVCDNIEKELINIYKPRNMTFRFGLGYGDLPIEQEPEFLNLLNAQKEIGVCSSSSYLLTPCKSVACIIGLQY